MSATQTGSWSTGVPFSRREQLIEVLVFLFLIGPSLALSFLPGGTSNISFAVEAIATILRDLALVALIFFFLWRNREAIGTIGWNARRFGVDILIGIVLFIPMFLGASWLESFLVSIGFSTPPPASGSGITPSNTTVDIILAVLLVMVVAVSEETIFRGYLIGRFSNILGSPVVALLLASVVFAIGHGYEGTAGVLTVGTMGLVFGIVYLWRKSLVAPMTMHFLQDFLAIVLAPLLTGGFIKM
jgi:membrane protease YdiL (CAAX protease family)